MAVTYDNVAFGRIEEALKQYLDDEFQQFLQEEGIK